MNNSRSGDEKTPFPHFHSPLMTEDQLIEYLRIPEISKGKNPHNVIDNLKRMHDLPCIHICKQPLYPIEAIRQWIMEKVEKEQN